MKSLFILLKKAQALVQKTSRKNVMSAVLILSSFLAGFHNKIIQLCSLNKVFQQCRNPRAMTFLCWLHHIARILETFSCFVAEDFIDSCKTYNTCIHLGDKLKLTAFLNS
jgi:hypothetical protein